VRGLLAERASTLRRRWREVRAFQTATLDPKWYGHLLEALASRQQQNYLVSLQQPTAASGSKSALLGWLRAGDLLGKSPKGCARRNDDATARARIGRTPRL